MVIIHDIDRGATRSATVSAANDFTMNAKISHRFIIAFAMWFSAGLAGAVEIDRAAMVRRHDPVVTKLDPLAALSLGNGTFAFTADITGLQTFPEEYQAGIPLHTQAEWGWHSFPNPANYKLADCLEEYAVGDRQVSYASQQSGPAADWLRANPHRIDLGRLGFRLRNADGSAVTASELTEIHQSLDLWRGVIVSKFKCAGEPVTVRTACHPERAGLAVEVVSPLVGKKQLSVELSFPGAKADWKQCADWTTPNAHQTTLSGKRGSWTFARRLNDTRYFVRLASADSTANVTETEPHHFELSATTKNSLAFTCEFAPEAFAAESKPLACAEIFDSTSAKWEPFWKSGAALDLSASRDPRAKELERRVVLSQYLTAIQCAGTMPPQETGLTYNSWFGKSHLEMHWWHAAHFALWGRCELLERSLGWYERTLPVAQALAERQGFNGARWPKMVGPDGAESPSKIAPFLIWQQTHPIYFAELCYRAEPTPETLNRYQALVAESAEFMASFPLLNSRTGRYDLGPALIPAQECYDPRTTLNPTYELAAWWWGLETAQQWRLRAGLTREPRWDELQQMLARPTVRDGVYTAISTPPFTNRHDHPSLLCALGVTPSTPLIDRAIMNRTFDDVRDNWEWPTTWGWDYPTLAMTAARLGRPADAIEALLMPVQKNTYLPNGHNYQDERLTLYLPGNGGLLAAVAMMAGGWEDGPESPAPGFPTRDAGWEVKAEGFQKMP